jgi:hypothetical protein
MINYELNLLEVLKKSLFRPPAPQEGYENL